MATQQTAAGRSKAATQPQGKPGTHSPAAEATQERDEVYGLVSVLYHSLQGAENYARYAEDARSAGDDEVADFFQDCRTDEIERADRAKELLAARLEVQDDGDDDDDDDE